MKLMKHAGALLTGLAMLVLCLVLRGADPALLVAQRLAGFDTLQRLWPREAPEGLPVRVIDIDEASLARLGQWPWSRNTLAKLVQELKELGAASIAFDIVFPEPDRTSPRRLAQEPALAGALSSASAAGALPDYDQEFAAAISTMPVTLAFARGDRLAAAELPTKLGSAQTGAPAFGAPPQLSRVTANLPELQTAASGLGSINIDLAAQQGVAREMALIWSDGTRYFPVLAVDALRQAQGLDTILINADNDQENNLTSVRVGDVEIPVTENGVFPLYFRHDDPALYVPAAEVIDGKARDKLRPLIEGHIVFVGTSAVGLLDSRTTPLGETVAGVSIHAQALEQILTGAFLERPDWLAGLELSLASLLAFAATVLSIRFRPAAATALTGLAVIAVLAAVAYAFRELGLLFDATFPLITLFFTFLATTAYRLLVTDRRGRQLRHLFGHYVAPSVLEAIERNPDNLKLGGEVRPVTLLFVDIADFTPLSEKLKPDELVAVVNGLWDHCSKAILAENGTIDKFIGDAIMAFWNAPVACDNHQYRACRAALGIRQALAGYNESPALRDRLEPLKLWPLKIRIGLASGDACVGNMGSSERFDYSVIGETVNTAARAESACKHVHHDIVLAGEVDPATQQLALLPAGYVPLKGRTLPQPISVIIGDEQVAHTESFQALVKEHAFLVAGIADAHEAKSEPVAVAHLLAELALHHPGLAAYLKALPGRSVDFARGALTQ